MQSYPYFTKSAEKAIAAARKQLEANRAGIARAVALAYLCEAHAEEVRAEAAMRANPTEATFRAWREAESTARIAVAAADKAEAAVDEAEAAARSAVDEALKAD